MTRPEIAAIVAAVFILGGSVWAWRAWRRKPAPAAPVVAAEKPRADDEFETLHIAMAQQVRDHIEADVRARVQAERMQRPKWMKPLERSRQARHDAAKPGGVRALPPASIEDTQGIGRGGHPSEKDVHTTSLPKLPDGPGPGSDTGTKGGRGYDPYGWRPERDVD